MTTVPDSGTKGTWVDETDIRPTLMYLVGLRDDYEHDGRVISQILLENNPNLTSSDVEALGDCYKQLNSSVGEFGTSTLIASTAGLESSSPGDETYTDIENAPSRLEQERDQVAGEMKASLEAAAFDGRPVNDVRGETEQCMSIIASADRLADSSSG